MVTAVNAEIVGIRYTNLIKDKDSGRIRICGTDFC